MHEYLLDHGAYPSTLGYKGFPKSCCTSLNEVICHGIPDSTVIDDGDIVNIDVTAYIDGVHGDTNATFLAGDVSEEARLLVERTHEATMRAIKAVAPGRELNVMGRVIESYAKRFGYGVVRDFTGHGVGATFHNGLIGAALRRAERWTPCIEPGMTFTIEPMINAGHASTTKSGLTAGPWRPRTRCAPRSSSTPSWSPTDGAEILTLPSHGPRITLRGALLVAGTTRDAGKSVLVAAGLCRLLARRGCRWRRSRRRTCPTTRSSPPTVARSVARRPRRRWRAGLAPSVRFNPVLLKPGSDRRSQLVVLGQAVGDGRRGCLPRTAAELLDVVVGALASLRAEFDVVICEGAGSPRRSTCAPPTSRTWVWRRPPTCRSWWSATSTAGACSRTCPAPSPCCGRRPSAGRRLRDQQVPRRPSLLEPGLDQLRALTGRPTLGVLP